MEKSLSTEEAAGGAGAAGTDTIIITNTEPPMSEEIIEAATKRTRRIVSIEQTTRKYRGRKAATYDEIRRKQQRWHLENEAVERMMANATGTVLDVPVGTGRYLPLWHRLGLACAGIDASEEMLALARATVNPEDKVTLEDA
jgi:2-polyprenyl-3-methyl-5-hydroxy-6-metoxy-1,4-benzoquinol methylase